MKSNEGIEAKGIELGIGPFDAGAEPPGEGAAWSRYFVRVGRAAGYITTATRRTAR